MYINSNLKCNIVGDMTTVVDSNIETITVEIINKKETNAIISCVYRSPGSCIVAFTDKIMEPFDRSSNKIVFLCGDFNILSVILKMQVD